MGALFFLFLLTGHCAFQLVNSASRGAEIRLTNKGMKYGATIGVKKLQEDLRNKRIDAINGRNGIVTWGAENIVLQYVNIGGYNVAPIPNVGLTVSVSGISVSASGKVRYTAKKGWVKFSDSSNVKIKGNGISFTLKVKLDAKYGKPVLESIGCSAHVSEIDLDFSGGLSWIYNLFSSYLEKKLRDPITKILCKEGQKVINTKANDFLSKFPVTKKIDKWAVIDYSFEQPLITNTYIDLLLRGEFLSVQNPKPSGITPPNFDTVDSSNKMLYVWLSEFTINSAGRIYHESGFLTKLTTPNDKFIPDIVKPFLNTKVFEKFLPEVYKQYPDLPLQFNVETFKAPSIALNPGHAELMLYAKVAVQVVENSGKVTQIFFVNLSVSAKGFVKLFDDNGELNVGGNINDFSFKAEVGGSIVGDIVIPVDNKSIKDMVQGLVIDQANPVLNKGFAIPKIKGLTFRSPSVTIVKHAVRVDTDVEHMD